MGAPQYKQYWKQVAWHKEDAALKVLILQAEDPMT